MKRIAIACIIALMLCVGCESPENKDEKSVSSGQKVTEITTVEKTTEEDTSEATETTTEEVTTTEPEDETTVTTKNTETTAETVTTATTSENTATVTTVKTEESTTKTTTKKVRETVSPEDLPEVPDNEQFIIFDDEDDENNENNDIPEEIPTEESGDETDSDVIELPFIPIGEL